MLLLAVEATEAPTECEAFDVLCQSTVPLVGDRIRELFLTMAAGVLEWVAAWWTEVPSPSLTDGFAGQMRGHALALSVAVLVLGLVIQAGRMIWMRRAAPLVDTITGMSTYVIVVAVAVPLAAGGLVAGDAFAAALLGGEGDQQVAARVVAELAATPHTGVVVLLGLLGSMAGVLLAAMMMLREMSVLLLAATLPVAAAGRLVPGIGNWLPAVLRWVAALVLWKPAAALVHAAGSRLMAPEEPRSLLVGVVTLGLAVMALPALARWLAPTAQSASRGLLGGAGAVTGSGRSSSRLVARGPTLQQQVARIERDFGSPAGRSMPPPGTVVGGRGPSGAALAGRPRLADDLGGHPGAADDGSRPEGDRRTNGHRDGGVGTLSDDRHGDDPGGGAADDPGTPPLWHGNGNGNGRHEGTR